MSNIIYTAKGKDIARTYHKRKFPIPLFYLAAAFLISAALAYFFEFSNWKVEEINIEGISTLNPNEIRSFIFKELAGKYTLIFPKNLIFLFSSKRLASDLKNRFPIISDVKIYKKYPDKLKLTIEERKFWGIFCASSNISAKINSLPAVQDPEEKCAFVDKTGFAYDEAPPSRGYVIVKIRRDSPDFEIPSQVLDTALFQKLIDLEKKLNSILDAHALQYTLFSKTPEEVRIKLNEGFEIYFNLEEDLEKSLKVLETVLREEIKDRRPELEYIDLRFGNKVFYKMRSK